MVSDGTHAYDARNIQVLEGRDVIRKRPGMYIGSTGERGLHHMVFEVVRRAVSEVASGRAGRVDIMLTADGGVRVTDDGPGIPDLKATLTNWMAMGRRGDRHAVGGGMPANLGIANALSRRLTAEVRRDGVRAVQECERGALVAPVTEAWPGIGSGTTITFWPDPEIFQALDFSFAKLAGHFRELAFLYRELEISLTDLRDPTETRSVRFRYPNGVADLVALLDEPDESSGHPVVRFVWEDTRMAGTGEVALTWRWSGAGGTRLRSFANGRCTPCGGSHEVGFRDGLAAAFTAYAREHDLLTAADPDLDPERTSEGLTAVVSVKLDRPEYEGATHERLGNRPVRACVAQAVQEHLGTWLEAHPHWAADVARRIVEEARQS